VAVADESSAEDGFDGGQVLLDVVAEICVCPGVAWHPVGMCWLYLK